MHQVGPEEVIFYFTSLNCIKVSDFLTLFVVLKTEMINELLLFNYWK